MNIKRSTIRSYRLIILSAVFLSISFASISQKIYNVWTFGEQGGINFNTTKPTGFKSKTNIDSPIYHSSICDRNGNLMFYTDGITVWNRYGFRMPKYNNWWPLAGKVMPLICPRPGSDTLFYLFAISDAANPYELQAFPLRLRASGDIDEMIFPRPTGPNNFQERMKKKCSMVVAATHHCNTKDYWVSTYSEHAMYSFLVTEAGISDVPVVTYISDAIIKDSFLNAGLSNLKFSANGEKAVVPDIRRNKVIVLDFDNATGEFKNPIQIKIDEGKFVEEAELSPDGSKLYVARKYRENERLVNHDVVQMDLKAGSVEDIESSLIVVTPIPDAEFCSRAGCYFVYRTMNVGPDGKVYVGMRFADRATIKVDITLSVIDAPNTRGLNCLYKKSQLNIGTKYIFAGYNYMRSASYTLKENGITVQKQNCADKPVSFGLLFNKVDSVKWDFGDMASGANNFSKTLKPEHEYPAPGSYQVKAIIYSRCLVDTATTTITIQPDISVNVPVEIKDTTVCVGGILVLNARNGTSNAYVWDNGLIFPDRTITEAGHYKVIVMNDCSIAIKEFDVTYKVCPCTAFVPTAFTPNNDGLNDEFKPAVDCFVKDYRFSVFNRFGQMIFTSADPSKGWNGFVGPYHQATGTFIWQLQYVNPNTHQMNYQKGTVVLIR